MIRPVLNFLSLSPVTISQCSFEAAFEVASKAGYRGIGLRYNQLEEYIEAGHNLEDVAHLARENGLQLTEMAFLAEWQFHGGVPLICRRSRSKGSDEVSARLSDRLRIFLERCQELCCVNVTAVPAITEEGPITQGASDFACLCDVARPYGVRLCLEFMGTAVQIRNLMSGWEVVALANRSNGGLLIDTFLFYQGRSTLEDLTKIPIETVFSVHLADAKPGPPEQLDMLQDRLFPGDGVTPIRAIVGALVKRGYAGWWTVEIFNPDYAKADAIDIATTARKKVEDLFDSLGLMS